MRLDSQVKRHVDEDDLYIEFSDELKQPYGHIHIRAEQADDGVVCRAEWGGWSWRAEGPDRTTAHARLSERLARLNPFHHADADWGHPGHQVGPLDEAIPPRTRQRMRDYTQREARSAVGLLEAVFEAQARRPWAFPPEGAEVTPGIEIEGYVTKDKSLALFPHTFYEIANAYFGRTAPQALVRPRGGSHAIGAEHPGLAGALRRLNEKGYMSSTDGKLPHQVQSIEVYLFTPDPR